MTKNNDLIRREDAVRALRHIASVSRILAPKAARAFSAAADVIAALPAASSEVKK